tara:strand:- start:1860 stop:3917 length:2058 start_codon:yes stop_codon:yes gene_type:complete
MVAACLLLIGAGGVIADTYHRPLTTEEQQRLQQQATILLEPDAEVGLQRRTSAADALVRMRSLESTAALNDALRSGRVEPILAVLMAEARQPVPSPDLLPALLAILPDAPEDTVGSIGVLLARYAAAGSGCFETVATLARDTDRPIAARQRAIEVLGAFHAYPVPSVAVLVSMLEPDDTPAPIVDTATTALASLTGTTMDRADWIRWWADFDQADVAELLQTSIGTLHRTTVAFDHRLRQAESEADLASQRMIWAYADLLPLLPLDVQQQKVLELLDDPLAAVRNFAVFRVSFMLGDGHDTPELQEAVGRLLTDPDTLTRRRASALLKQLDQVEIDAVVLTRLELEEDEEVLKSLLDYLSARRTISAVDPTRRLLGVPELREPAARTLRAILLEHPELDDEVRRRIARDARTALAPSTWQSIAPLLVLTGNEDDLRSLEVILDNPDPEVRATVANAFLQRGRDDALLTRASDDRIYPFALTAARRRATDLPRLRMLLAMAPPTEHTEVWADAVAEATEIQDPIRILEIDDMIGAIPHANDQLRIRILNASLSRGGLDEAMQLRILKRLIPMLLEQDSPAAALTLIQAIDEGLLDEQLLDMKFISAIRATLYEDAAGIHDDPDMWIRAYQDTLASRPESAPDLLQEIVRRYNDQLDAERRATLGLVDDPLMPDDEPISEDPDDPDA